ncbi:[Acyl-carrier-protein] S-malonyltransferase [Psychromonas ingrahamii 37]|uniref:Malonyl CoA-acyl carrier protein transacylase n=1 Tax=Psychromonas ingrahamii (strain DSM 17664 / CCUG 51855 / 37) TaxID=357804 RepID=A1STW2_PSYIN|nr:ACP S-malonyltransferase [Psychromonas ingrahamii]ABM02927.1 [Acyl-carrier-protein] S-malonyltransferase [Psychromonas ingrahamii 37]
MTNFTFAFPGQGSQHVGMLAELAQSCPVVVETFKQASDVLGYDLWDLVQQGPAEILNQTDKTQPALLTASVALWRVWAEQKGPTPSVIAGHSLGEYSALVCAGVIEFKDAVKLVELRGQLMQQAVPAGTGAMSAIIGLDNNKIAECCVQAAEGQIVSPVNFNSPGQVVIAGNKEAVERAGILLKEAGAKRVLPLPVSVPSHCALMKPAAEKLAVALQSIHFNTPNIAVINNVDVVAESDVEKIKDALVRQLFCPVRWSDIVEKMASDGITIQVEAGPGKVLSGLVRRINKSLTAQVINDNATLEKALAAVKGE